MIKKHGSLDIFLLLSIFGQALSASEARYQVDTAYRHEAVDAHTLGSIATQPFTPYSGTLRLGFQEGDTWIRLIIQAPKGTPLGAPNDAVQWPVLRVGPYF